MGIFTLNTVTKCTVENEKKNFLKGVNNLVQKFFLKGINKFVKKKNYLKGVIKFVKKKLSVTNSKWIISSLNRMK